MVVSLSMAAGQTVNRLTKEAVPGVAENQVGLRHWFAPPLHWKTALIGFQRNGRGRDKGGGVAWMIMS